MWMGSRKRRDGPLVVAGVRGAGGLFLFVEGRGWGVGSGRDMLRVREHFEPLIE